MKKDISSAPIGVFDSGIGGLSIAKHISQQLPNENLIYVADNHYSPYGEKSTDFIIQRVNLISQQLVELGVKAIVIACNTATIHAIAHIRSRFTSVLNNNQPIPIIGVEPAIKPAAKYTNTKKVAVLVTQASYNNQRFHDLINLHKNDAQVFIQPCPGLVEIIEQGQQDSPYCYQLLSSYLNPLIQEGIDTLVLGCTHYPFLQKQINSIVGSSIKIIDTTAPVVSQLKVKLINNEILTTSVQQGKMQFYSSQPYDQQKTFLTNFWQTKIEFHHFPLL